MSDFTDYTENNVRDWMSQGSSMPSAPGTVYVALHTSDPGETPDGSTEVSGGSYAREGVSAGSGWSTSQGSFSNASTISFTQATGDWGTISHVSLWDASTNGNCLAAFDLDSNVTINTNDTLEFNSGQLSFSID